MAAYARCTGGLTASKIIAATYRAGATSGSISIASARRTQGGGPFCRGCTWCWSRNWRRGKCGSLSRCFGWCLSGGLRGSTRWSLCRVKSGGLSRCLSGSFSGSLSGGFGWCLSGSLGWPSCWCRGGRCGRSWRRCRSGRFGCDARVVSVVIRRTELVASLAFTVIGVTILVCRLEP